MKSPELDHLPLDVLASLHMRAPHGSGCAEMKTRQENDRSYKRITRTRKNPLLNGCADRPLHPNFIPLVRADDDHTQFAVDICVVAAIPSGTMSGF